MEKLLEKMDEYIQYLDCVDLQVYMCVKIYVEHIKRATYFMLIIPQ